MMNYRSTKLDHFWMWFVLLHVVGSSLVSIVMGSQTLLMATNSIMWIYCAYANRKSKAGILLSGVGWSISLYLLTHLSLGCSSVLLLIFFKMTYVLYLHFGSLSMIIGENHIRRIQILDLFYILAFTMLLLTIGQYVNGLSMIFFHNYLTNAISFMTEELPAAILVFALMPAILEEIVFRGYVFQRLGNAKKAIFVSAMLFALGHMNFNQMSYAFVIGIFFAVIYKVTGNLTYTIIIHFLYNLYSILVSFFEETSLVKNLLAMQMAGYHFFNVCLTDEKGNVLISAVILGAIVSMIALILYGLLLRQLAGRNGQCHMEAKEENWRPGLAFCISTITCLVISLLLESAV